jgi:hypothetical protein
MNDESSEEREPREWLRWLMDHIEGQVALRAEIVGFVCVDRI